MLYTSVSRYHRLATAYSPSSDYVSLFRSAVFSFSRRPGRLLSNSNTASSAARRFLRLLFRPSTASYNALINSLLLANRTAAASAAFSSFLGSGLPLNTSSFTIFLKLILSSSRASRFDDAYYLLGKMLQFGPLPDAVTYSTFIAALSREGRITEAVGVLDFMLENRCTPTPHACTSLIHGYCSQGNIKEAKRFLCLIETYGFAPDAFMYTVLIDALSRNGEFNEVESILSESHSKGWKPNEGTYNVYMNGLCKAGRIDEAFGLLDAMKCNGLFPTLETLNILFDCLCRDCKLREAVELLGKSSESDWSPDAVFYNTLFSRFLEHGLCMNVLPLLSDMVKRGIEPNACTLTLIIRSLFPAGKLQMATYLINCSWNFVPDVFAFNTLLHQLYRSGGNKEVLNVFAGMVQKNVAPNKFTYCIVIDSLYKEKKIEEAVDLVLGTIRDEFFQDLIRRLLRLFARGRKFGEILKLFQKMGQDFYVDATCFNSLIMACCKAGICRNRNFYRLSIIIDKILEAM